MLVLTLFCLSVMIVLKRLLKLNFRISSRLWLMYLNIYNIRICQQKHQNKLLLMVPVRRLNLHLFLYLKLLLLLHKPCLLFLFRIPPIQTPLQVLLNHFPFLLNILLFNHSLLVLSLISRPHLVLNKVILHLSQLLWLTLKPHLITRSR